MNQWLVAGGVILAIYFFTKKKGISSAGVSLGMFYRVTEEMEMDGWLLRPGDRLIVSLIEPTTTDAIVIFRRVGYSEEVTLKEMMSVIEDHLRNGTLVDATSSGESISSGPIV